MTPRPLQLPGDPPLALAEHVVDRGRDRGEHLRALAFGGAADGSRPGNSSAMKPVESLPARQRGCCISAARNGMLWRMPSIDEGVERVGLRVDRGRARLARA